MLDIVIAFGALILVPMIIIFPCMLVLFRLEASGYNRRSKTFALVVFAPIAIVAINMIFPGWHESDLSWALIITAIFYCVLLSKAGMKASTLCSIPALICIISGVDGAYDLAHYGVGTPSELAEKFCYFICGVWCLYFMVKSTENKQ